MQVKSYAECVDGRKNRKSWQSSPDAKKRVRQEFVEETDTKFIVDRFFRSGVPLPTAAQTKLAYSDLSQTPETLQEAFQKVADAREAFAALPSDLRALVNNDPKRLLEAYSTPQGRKFLGQALATKEQKEAAGQAAKAAQKEKRKATSSEDDEEEADQKTPPKRRSTPITP